MEHWRVRFAVVGFHVGDFYVASACFHDAVLLLIGWRMLLQAWVCNSMLAKL